MKSKQLSLPFFLLFIALFFYNASALAELACMKGVQNEEDINICQHSEATRLALELNDLEHSIRSRFKSPQIERFDEAQNRWLQMTEKDCEIEAAFYEGATIYLAIHSECLQRHYLERLVTLKKYVCPEPNLGNGCHLNNSAPVPAVVELPPTDSRVKSSVKPGKIKNSTRFR